MGREKTILLGFLGLLAGVFVGALSLKLLVPRPPTGAGPDIRTDVGVVTPQERVEPPVPTPGGSSRPPWSGSTCWLSKLIGAGDVSGALWMMTYHQAAANSAIVRKIGISAARTFLITKPYVAGRPSGAVPAIEPGRNAAPTRAMNTRF